MKKFSKMMLSLFILAAGLLMIITNFSSVETRYECSGKLSNQNQNEDKTIFIKLEKYRWWVGLWSNGSEGNVKLEIPNITVSYYSWINKITDDLLQIKEDKQTLSGSFSYLSKALSLKTPVGFFEGICKEVKK